MKNLMKGLPMPEAVSPRIVRAYSPVPSEGELDMNVRFSRVGADTVIGQSYANPQTCKRDLYFSSDALSVAGFTDALNKLNGNVGHVFIVTAQEVSNPEAIKAKIVEISRLVAPINMERFKTNVKYRKPQTVVFGFDGALYVTENCETLTPLDPACQQKAQIRKFVR